ncbi:TPA: hypothetical protein QDC20_000150 [Burkholderia aenigmatica]|uniref:hypothetical protein n=1 Tax=Burkholderia sp. AU45251 TaxID=3059204 RepID=UPI00264BDE4A|nr:hypothetical protein [Burkholderia sp. AU45251]HDR9483057.1 hypothetical protein [Burkholderia aenigmatica]MDN7515920.1 hypothetical protein [Burkholderia sp. AU45251]HDR9514005.1 hypothetical protein [Burkholderia aenigmatica]HDR9591395.1 hypothetical protein [Burkholderia aenigmatica]HDR9598487.1 hypothetical protein [Burkholderia aenigmatica]
MSTIRVGLVTKMRSDGDLRPFQPTIGQIAKNDSLAFVWLVSDASSVYSVAWRAIRRRESNGRLQHGFGA